MKLNKGEYLVAVRWSYWIDDFGTWYFAAREPGAEQTIRKAMTDYRIATGAVEFTWGDAIEQIPPEHWAKYGLRFLPLPEPDVRSEERRGGEECR